MALTGSINLKGISLTNAYVQITRVFGGPKDDGWQCVLRVYASQAARAANEADFLLEKNMATPAPFTSGQDGFTACFAHMKATGGEFAGFTDVLP